MLWGFWKISISQSCSKVEAFFFLLLLSFFLLNFHLFRISLAFWHFFLLCFWLLEQGINAVNYTDYELFIGECWISRSVISCTIRYTVTPQLINLDSAISIKFNAQVCCWRILKRSAQCLQQSSNINSSNSFRFCQVVRHYTADPLHCNATIS